jgi:hypothetical protein
MALRNAGIVSAPQDVNTGVAQNLAVQGDKTAYALSDADFAARFPQLSAGLKTYADKASTALNTPSTGLSLTPDVENQFVKAGLTKSLGNLGAQNLTNLQSGGAGQSQVAKNLGLDLLDFQQKNISAVQQQDQFKNAQFASALQIDPQRQIGLGGNAMAQIYANNLGQQNAYNSGLGSSLLSGVNNINSANAANGANSSNALMGAGVSAIGSIASVAAFACWVAREVYGVRGIRWMIFRFWMLEKSPRLFRAGYLKYGERFANFIADKPAIKSLVRLWMDSKIDAVLS